jgi:hypothetical protein
VQAILTAVSFYDCGLKTLLLQALLQQRQQLLQQLRLVEHCQLVLVHLYSITIHHTAYATDARQDK